MQTLPRLAGFLNRRRKWGVGTWARSWFVFENNTIIQLDKSNVRHGTRGAGSRRLDGNTSNADLDHAGRHLRCQRLDQLEHSHHGRAVLFLLWYERVRSSLCSLRPLHGQLMFRASRQATLLSDHVPRQLEGGAAG